MCVCVCVCTSLYVGVSKYVDTLYGPRYVKRQLPTHTHTHTLGGRATTQKVYRNRKTFLVKLIPGSFLSFGAPGTAWRGKGRGGGEGGGGGGGGGGERGEGK